MKKIIGFFALLLMLALPWQVSAQFNIPKRVENKTVNRVNNRIDRGIDKGLDAVENDITGKNKKQDNKNDKANSPQDESGERKDQKNGTGNDNPANETPSLQTYSKYDFVPGEKVIFYEDFSQEAVGDFPTVWNTNGSAEVVTTNLFPGKWMKFVTRNCIWTDALLDLPDNYTIEYDVIPIQGEEEGMAGYQVRLMQANNVNAWDAGTAPGKGGFLMTVEYYGRPSYHTWFIKNECQASGLDGYKEDKHDYQQKDQLYHMAIWVQKTRIRVYQNQDKLFDLPRAIPAGCIKMDRLRFEDGAAMVSNIRIAVGAPDMRSKLLTEGKLVSYGIYFDVNKDVVKPESYATLKTIADVLTENPAVRVKIVGYTDSDGPDAANLDLSKRRGAAVKAELVKSFGIDASRLESDGLGESQPVAPNDTPANKALNRRVEFIKL